MDTEILTSNVSSSLPLENDVQKLLENDNFKRNLDGSVDSRDSDFRKILQFASKKPYPVNKDGSPDMRCTTNPHILQMKIDKLLKR